MGSGDWGAGSGDRGAGIGERGSEVGEWGAGVGLRAVAVAPAALAWLKQTASLTSIPPVHHSPFTIHNSQFPIPHSPFPLFQLFDHACNLINAHNDILSLVTPTIGPGPLAIVVEWADGPADRPLLWPEWLARDTAVTITPSSLLIGPFRLDVTGAPIWPARPDWEALRAQQAGWRSGFTGALVQGAGIGGLRDEENPLIRQSPPFSFESVLANAAVAGIQMLLVGVAQGDLALCVAGAEKLAGLGEGLTPAGDDFLLGAIYGLWATRPRWGVERVVPALVAAAVPRTTRLSAAWLRAAARGEAAVAWHDLANGLAVNGEEAVATAVSRIQATGHTSGKAALSGFVKVVSLDYNSAANERFLDTRGRTPRPSF
jgi:hypothetical protein